ncbi:MAG: serine hydrolase domain-containing protein, partial [Bacteroidota bacterium]
MMKLKTTFDLMLMIVLMFLMACGDTPIDQTQAQQAPNPVRNIAGQVISMDSLNAYLDTTMKAYQITGSAVAIVNDGAVVYHHTHGYADIGENKPVTEQTIFEGASISKSVFASMVMLMVEEGKLDLDRPLHEYLDQHYYGIDEKDDRYEKITARHVLSHTTGFPNWRETDDLPIAFEPGSAFSYSGEGFIFLERVLMHLLKIDYVGLESYFQSTIGKKLGLQWTKFVQDDFNRTHKARPYQQTNPLNINPWEGKEFNSASAIHSEALEFSKWMIALMGNDLLSEKAIGQLF